MKFFYWNLNNKEKFVRSLWTGLLALLFLYVVVWYYVDDLTIKIVFPITLTIVYIAGLFYRYYKCRNNEMLK